jgi:DNA-binding NarL/FixJ family response regulator
MPYDALVASTAGVPAPAKAAARARHTTDLSEREIEVLHLVAQGLSNPQIANTLAISRKTVEHHLEHTYNKLGISCRTAAVAYAIQHRLMDLGA